MNTEKPKTYKNSTHQPNQKQNGPGERPSHEIEGAGDPSKRNASQRGDKRGEAASSNRLDATNDKSDERYNDDDFGQANDVTAASRGDDEGSHEPGQSQGSMSSDRGLRASHAQKRTAVSEQEELLKSRPNRDV